MEINEEMCYEQCWTGQQFGIDWVDVRHFTSRPQHFVVVLPEDKCMQEMFLGWRRQKVLI